MMEVENIGYDTTGKSIKGSELVKVSRQIRDFVNQNK